MADPQLTLQEAVGQLADYTAAEIADLLRLADKPGIRNEPTACPLANYFSDVLDGGGYVVGSDNVAPRYRIATRHEMPPPLPLPEGVQMFIEAFDCGQYPDLVIDEDEDPTA